MGMSYNVSSLEAFAYVNHQNHRTGAYQLTNTALIDPAEPSTQIYLSTPVDAAAILESQKAEKELSYQVNQINGGLPSQMISYQGNSYLELRPSDNLNRIEIVSSPINLIQVPSNLIVANNNLILCLPPEGITLQLQQQPQSQQTIPTNISAFTQQHEQQEASSQTHLLEKARQWHKDSHLANRAILSLKTIK